MSKKDELLGKMNLQKIDQEAERESVRGRMSKSRYKSGPRGPRDYKLTIPVPSSLNEDVRAICGITGVSVTDLINQYLEQYVKENSKTLEALRKIREDQRGRHDEGDPTNGPRHTRGGYQAPETGPVQV